MRVLDLIHAHLDTEHVPHATIGAAALAAYGVARSTFDIDLLVVDRRCLDDSFWDAIRTRDVRIEVRRGDASDPLAGVVRIEPRAERPVDVIVGKATWQRRALDRARRLSDGPSVVQPRDLVLLKLYAGGTQDLWDLKQLLALPGAEALAAAVEEELGDLPAEAAAHWREVNPAGGA